MASTGRISRDEILQGREQKYPLSPLLEGNLSKLLDCVNKFRGLYGNPLVVNSGYRPAEFNVSAGGAPNSPHLTCEACDFRDTNGSLAAWCVQHLDILEQCSLYMESPTATKGWVHLQVRRPLSGNRVFIP